MIITTYRCLRFTPSSILSTPRSRLRALSTIPHCSRWVDLVSVPLRRTILSDPLKSIRLRPAVTSANYHNLLENPFTKRLAIFRYHINVIKYYFYFFYPWLWCRFFSYYAPGHRVYESTLDSHVFKGIVTHSLRAIIKLLNQFIIHLLFIIA